MNLAICVNLLQISDDSQLRWTVEMVNSNASELVSSLQFAAALREPLAIGGLDISQCHARSSPAENLRSSRDPQQ
jgi:hypothetical protein